MRVAKTFTVWKCVKALRIVDVDTEEIRTVQVVDSVIVVGTNEAETIVANLITVVGIREAEKIVVVSLIVVGTSRAEKIVVVS